MQLECVSKAVVMKYGPNCHEHQQIPETSRQIQMDTSFLTVLV